MSTNVAVEFLIWMLIAASAIAVVADRLRIPYTVALVVGGLALVAFHIPLVDDIIRQEPSWLTRMSASLFSYPRCFSKAA